MPKDQFILSCGSFRGTKQRYYLGSNGMWSPTKSQKKALRIFFSKEDALTAANFHREKPDLKVISI